MGGWVGGWVGERTTQARKTLDTKIAQAHKSAVDYTKKRTRRSHTAGEGDGGRGKGLQLRPELGNVVTGEGERERRVVVGDYTDKVWEGKPTCVGKTDVCETTVTHEPLSTTIHDTMENSVKGLGWAKYEGGGVQSAQTRHHSLPLCSSG